MGPSFNCPFSLNFEFCIAADTGSNRQSRQFVTLPTGLAAGATLLEMGLFRNPTELNHQPCVSPKNE